jgi:hypothetical protein
MGVSAPRERRPAIWPWLLMPAIVLLVFYALFRAHHKAAPLPPPAPSAATADGG